MEQQGCSDTKQKIDDNTVQQRQADALRQRQEREKRLQEIRLSEEKARQDLLEDTRRRQLELQDWRHSELERLSELELVQRRRQAFESQALSDPERLVGLRALVNGCEGTIEAWYPPGMGMEGRWKILTDDGHEEELTKISVDQVVDISELQTSLEHSQSLGSSSVNLMARASSSKSLGLSFSSSSSASLVVSADKLKGLKGARIHIDGMGPGVVSDYLGICKRDKIFGRMCVFANRRPTHRILFDDGREEDVNLGPKGPFHSLLPDLKDTEDENDIRRPLHDWGPLTLQQVMDALNVSLKACRANPNNDEAQKGKARLEALVAGLDHAKNVLSQSPESLESAMPCLQEMLSSLQRISRLLGNRSEKNGQERIADKAAELKLAFDNLERARWDLIFQLNLETVTGKMNEKKLSIEAAVARANLRKHEIHAKDIVFGQFLGEGGFAKVYMCEWQGAKAAAKCFDLRNLSTRQHEHLVRSFNRETEVAFNLRSPRLLQIFGICTSVADRLYIIMELAVGGTVRAVLDAAKDPLPSPKLWGLARDTAFGMRYLHGHSIVHRDLKSQNVLLDAGGAAKVADFGVARTAAKLQEMSTVRSSPKGLVGTVAWMAPEALHGEAGFSSDVFSFGVFMWEVATRKIPWEGENIANIIYRVCFNNARLPIDDKRMAGYDIRQLLSRCWEEKGDERPTFEELEKYTTARYSGRSAESDDMLSARPPARKPKKQFVEVRVEQLKPAAKKDAGRHEQVEVTAYENHLLQTPPKMHAKALANRSTHEVRSNRTLPKESRIAFDANTSKIDSPDMLTKLKTNAATRQEHILRSPSAPNLVSQAPPSRPVCPKAQPQQTPLSNIIGYSTGHKTMECTPIKKQSQDEQNSLRSGPPRHHPMLKMPPRSTIVASRSPGVHARLAHSTNVANANASRDVGYGMIVGRPVLGPTPKVFGAQRLAQTGQ